MIAQTTSFRTYPDEYIEAFAERFVQRGLFDRGIEFVDYLENPKRYDPHLDLETLTDRERDQSIFEPLLPEQRAVQARLDAEAEAEAAEQQLERECPDVACHGGAMLEPLHHHKYVARSARAHFRGKGGRHE